MLFPLARSETTYPSWSPERCELDQSHEIERHRSPLVRQEQELGRTGAPRRPEARYFSIKRDDGIVYEESYSQRRHELHSRVSEVNVPAVATLQYSWM